MKTIFLFQLFVTWLEVRVQTAMLRKETLLGHFGTLSVLILFNLNFMAHLTMMSITKTCPGNGTVDTLLKNSQVAYRYNPLHIFNFMVLVIFSDQFLPLLGPLQVFRFNKKTWSYINTLFGVSELSTEQWTSSVMYFLSGHLLVFTCEMASTG